MPHDDIWRYTTVPDTGRVILQRRFDFDIRPLRAIDFVMTKKVDLGLVLIRVNGRNVPWEKFKISWYERNGEWILRLDMSKWVTGMPWPQATPKFEEMQIFMDQGYNPVKGKDFPIKEVIFRKENMGLVPDKGMEGIFRTDKSPVITYRQGDVTRLLVPIETYNQFLGNKVKGASAPRLVATRFVVDTKNENKWAGVRIRDVRLVRFDDVEIPNYLQRGTDIMSAMGGVEFPSALFPQNVEWAVPLAYQRMGGYSFTVGARERKAELRRKAEKAELRRKAKRDKLRRKFERNMPRWKVKIFKRYWKAKNKRYNRERLMKERKALSAKQWLFDPRTIAREGAEACAAGEKPVVSRRLRGLPYVVSNPAEFPEGRPGHPSTDPKKIKNFPDEQEWPFWSIYWPVNITLPERAYFNVALGDAADIYRVRVVPFVDGEPVAAFVQFPGRRVSLSSLKGKKIDCISVQFLFRSKAADVKVDNLSIVQPRLLSPKEAFETPTYWERETGLAFSDVELPDNYKNLSRWASEGETLNAVTRLKGGNQEPIQWLAEINRPLSEVANVYVDIKFSAAFIPNKDAVLKATLVGDKGTADVLLPLTAASQTLMIDKSRLMESADAIGSSLKRIVFSLKMVKFPYGMDQFMGLKVTMHMDVGEVRDLVSMLIGQSAVSFNDTRLKLGTPVFRDNATSRFSTNVGTIHLLDGDFPLLKGLDDPASLWRLDYLFLTRTNPIDEESWARILKL
ncbi:MAG TPA: hypothetical protein ENI72_00760, partial [Rhodospirillales bacterium]|nr:hypothetical protein [Rhodospirillales bacterium]